MTDKPTKDLESRQAASRLRSSYRFDEGEQPQVQSDCQRLSALLADTPEVRHRIKECIAFLLPVLRRGKYPRTSLIKQLNILFGGDGPARLVVRMLEIFDLEALDALKDQLDVDSSVIEFLKELYVTFGSSLNRAYRARSRPKDWFSLRVDVGSDSDGDPVIALSIERNDGKEIELAGPLRSIVAAQAGILESLRDDSVRASAQDVDALREMEKQLAELLGKLQERQNG